MEKNIEIEYNGEKLPLVFNLNVMERIQEEYESVDAWGKLTEADEPNARAIKFGFTEMINEGIDIYNESNEGVEGFKPRKPLTLRQVGRIITEVGLTTAAAKLNNAVIESTKSDEKN